ncbi:hypothetical protein BJ742DRAFT_855682 [Cladochytrium replicatum]|nr:hypothetical protein BJ742DRAFT_855682 [Cladochytrium replicatum]
MDSSSVTITTIFASTVILRLLSSLFPAVCDQPMRKDEDEASSQCNLGYSCCPGWNMTALFNDIRRNYGDIVAIHRKLVLGSWKQFHVSSTKELNEAEKVFCLDSLPSRNTTPFQMVTRSCYDPSPTSSMTTSLKKMLSERVSTWAIGSATGISFDVFEEIVGQKDTSLFELFQVFLIPIVPKRLRPLRTHDLGFNAFYLAFPFLGQKTSKDADRVQVETAQRQAQKHIDQGHRPGQIMANLHHYLHATSWLIYHLAFEVLNRLHFMDSLVREVIRMHQHGPSSKIAQTDLKVNGAMCRVGRWLPLAAIHFNGENLKDPFEFGRRCV